MKLITVRRHSHDADDVSHFCKQFSSVAYLGSHYLHSLFNHCHQISPTAFSPATTTTYVTPQTSFLTSTISLTFRTYSSATVVKLNFLLSFQFADDEDDDIEVKEPPKKKVNPSRGGSGLFSVLPEPKHAPAKEAGRSLVPHVLTKRPTQIKKPMKKVTKKPPAATTIVDNVSDDDEEEVSTGTSDFFSLSEEPDTNYAKVAPVLPSDHVPATIAPSSELIREEPRVPYTQPEGPTLSLEQHAHYHEVGPSTMEQEPSQPAAAATTGIDEATFLRLAGKRGRADVINFIDVNADDALLTRHEWMTKALSEEKPQHGFSKKREGLPTQKQKQKHQITYLAHQAKERELELKNAWAQNRMTKMQSQAKYGF